MGGPAGRRRRTRRSRRRSVDVPRSCRTPRRWTLPAGDPRHRVPGLRAGAPHAAGRDPRRDRGSRGLAARRRGARSPGGARQLVAFAIGAPLEQSKDVEGCDDDPMLGKHNTMYSVSITVAPSYQSSGIGRKLKELQLRDAAARKTRRRLAALSLRHRPQPRRSHRADDAPQPRVRRARRLGPHRPVRGSGRAGDLLPDPARRVRARIRSSSRTSLRRRAAAQPTMTTIDVRSRVGPDAAVRERPGVAARRRGAAACSTARRSTS